MQTTISRSRLYATMGRTAAIAFLAAAGTLGLYGQQSAGTASTLPPTPVKAGLAAPLNLTMPSVSTLNDVSSSSSDMATVDPDNVLNFDGAQPPPRRRYGRPNYNDSRTNSDGSPKYSVFAGGGFGLPTGGAHNYLTTGWGLQAGVSRNFDKHFGVALQFDYDHFGFQTNTLNNLLAIYQYIGVQDGYGDGGLIQQVGGTSHVWSFSLDPKYTFYDSGNKGAYVVVGAGFYHKTANLTTPGVGEYCTYYGCFEESANETIDKYTSNAPGFSGGIGFTYKPSRFANQRFFAEARYVFVDNQPRVFSFGNADGSGFNVFPQNSARTTYIPVKFGIIF